MAHKVAINGFGRIGRAVFRIAQEQTNKNIDIVAINDLSPVENLAYLLKFDSVHGAFKGSVEIKNGDLVVNGKKIKVLAEKDPKALPWKKLGVDVVVESTGVFTGRVGALQHIQAGAKKVVLTAPSDTKDEADITVCLGANQDLISKKHQVISNASCTTNCAVPVCKVIDEAFGIEKGYFTVIHSYTSTQSAVDSPHRKLRRGRAAALNIVPTTTGAADTAVKVLTNLKGKLDGMAVRVPVPDGSLLVLSAVVKKKASAEKVNQAFRASAAHGLKGILNYSEDELVSSDIIGSKYSSIVDGISTRVMGDSLIEVFAWFDNEWGYSSRVVELLDVVCKLI